MKKKKIIIISVTSIVLLAICANFFLKASPADSFQLITTKLSTDKISTTVTATGTVNPIISVEVGTQVSGIISKLYVDYNSVVRKGQILAELDKTTLQASLKSKELELKSAKTEYEYQKKNFERSKDLHGKNLISDTDYETAKYTYEKAESAYKKIISDLVTVRTNLSYATIYSPIDGVVLSRAVEEGQTVAASFSTPTLFTIAKDLTKMRVIAKVDEADIGSIKQGQRVTFTVDAYPNDVFDGQVTQVRLEATTTSNVVTYQVVVNAPNPDLKLKPGLTANITIFTLERNGVWVLPNKALNFKPDTEVMSHNGFTVSENVQISKNLKKDEKVVWQQDGKTIRNKRIKTGETDGINTEILSGITSRDEIITEMKTVNISDVSQTKSSETSPFMPKHPGSDSSKTQKK
jgi:HlyD family secretion protein